jgi:hypothetical protein
VRRLRKTRRGGNCNAAFTKESLSDMVGVMQIFAFCGAFLGLLLLGMAGGRFGLIGRICGGTLGLFLGFLAGLLVSLAIEALPDMSSRISRMSPRQQNVFAWALGIICAVVAIAMMKAGWWLFHLAREFGASP